MKLYRPKVTVSCEGCPDEKYYAPFITLFPSFKCARIAEEEFKSYSLLMYEAQYGVTEDDGVNVDIEYKILILAPLSNLWKRLITSLKHLV